MMLSYPLRVLFLALAAGYLLHAGLMLVLRLAAPLLRRRGARLPPRAAANWVLAWRVAPLALTAILTGGVALPVYLHGEPFGRGEEVGLGFLLAAALGAAAGGLALGRYLRAAWALARLERECRRGGERLAAECGLPVCAVRSAEPFMVLAGLRAPRVVVSSAALQRLTPMQLEAALRHEQAHQAAGDNWRRWLLLVLPDAVPGWHWRGAEGQWTRYSEWAADQAAAGGQPWRALHLAEALLAIGRGQDRGGRFGARFGGLVTGLASDGRELAARVDRLLAGPAAAPPRRHFPGWPALALASGCLAALPVAALWLLPRAAALYPLLERLVR